MNLTKEQLNAGVNAGLAITSPDSEMMVPVKHAAGIMVLHQLLIGIASGQVKLEAVPAEAPTQAPVEPE